MLSGDAPGLVGERSDASGWNWDARASSEEAETILFVEDETFVRNVTSEILRTAGYVVLAARTASEALAIYDEHHGELDLLLTDVILPGESGYALARKLRPEVPELAVLFITGYAEQMDGSELERSACLPKPFSTGELLRKIRETLDFQATGRMQLRGQESNALRRVSGTP
jgi:CheY-like chemotaxis protein